MPDIPPGLAEATAGRVPGAWPGAGDLGALDAIAERHHHGGGQPGLAYGIVAGGELVHARGLGERWLGGPAPDAGTAFRIASMTKSFTATAVLALRDEGALALDDPADRYVPELRGVRAPTADSPRVSLRHLLTMTAGFPTDDPWGDRQQGAPLGEFSRFLAQGARFAWAPATRFEYSNLGYAILGRVVAAVSGMGYEEFVRQRVIRPLGLASTGFEAAGFDGRHLARGYRRSPSGWEELPFDSSGAFAPMGGVFSTVRDLSAWASGFSAAFPPGGDSGGGHPLARATRREMQLPQVALPPREGSLPGGSLTVSYGFGLFVEEDAEHGRVVQHSGGYPGFGSHMRWHPATGIGVIVLGNGTYAPAQSLASKLLRALLRDAPDASRPAGAAPSASAHAAVRGLAPAPGQPWPETLRAQRQVAQLLLSWDASVADSLFSPNVAQDEPYAERQRTIERIRQRIGGIAEDQARPPEFDSPAHCRWWLRGEHGSVRAEIRLTPERIPRVQLLDLAVPPAAGSPLARFTDQIVSLLNGGAGAWPEDLPASAALDTDVLLRRFRAAAGWAGRCRPGAFWSGDGETSVAVELDGETARLILAVALDPVENCLDRAEITLVT